MTALAWLQVRLLPKHVPGLPEQFDISRLLLSALDKFVFVRVRYPQRNPATCQPDLYLGNLCIGCVTASVSQPRMSVWAAQAWLRSLLAFTRLRDRQGQLRRCVDMSQCVSRKLAGMAVVQVGVVNLEFSGRVRITLTGLMDSIPVVSLAQVNRPDPLVGSISNSVAKP